MKSSGENSSGELSVDKKNVTNGSLSTIKKKIRSKKFVRLPRRRSAIGRRTMRMGMDGTINLINSPNLKEVTCISRVDSFSSQQDVDDAETQKRNTNRRGSTSPKRKKKFFSDSAETVESMTMSKAKAKRRDSGSHRFHRRASLDQLINQW
jgi:hypothetical protein